MARSLSPRQWISAAPLLLLFIGSPLVGFADLKYPRLPFTLEQAARQTIAEYDLIVEAQLEAVSTDTISTTSVQCLQVGALTLTNVRSIWGRVSDPSIKVRSWATPTGVNPIDNECVRGGVGGSLPAIGARGLFLLVCEPHDTRMIPGNVPTLGNPEIDFLMKDERGLVTQSVLGHPFEWVYSELLSELARQVQAVSLETLALASEVIISGELGSYDDRDVDSVSVIYPLTVVHVFHGQVPPSSTLLAVPYHDPPGMDRAASMTQGVVNRNITERYLKPLLAGRRKNNLRVLILGRILPNGAIAPLNYGCLEIDDNGFVRGPAYAVASGQLARSSRSLSNLRAIFR